MLKKNTTALYQSQISRSCMPNSLKVAHMEVKDVERRTTDLSPKPLDPQNDDDQI